MHTKTNTKISDITIGELKKVISDSIKEAMENMIEEIKALSSQNFINSVKEARAEYKAGKVKKLKDILNV